MITSKQRAYLRELANPISPIFQVGKGGVGDALRKQVFDALEARELIKIHVLPNCDLSAAEVCRTLCDGVGANPVQVIGSKVVLYKRSREHKKIILPGERVPKSSKPAQKKSLQNSKSAQKKTLQGGKERHRKFARDGQR